MFFDAPLWVPPVPRAIEVALTALALAALALWVVRTVRRALGAWEPRDAGHHLYVLGHVAVFTLGYVAIDDPTRGWLAVNVWHNAQYLLFVWAWNHRRVDGPLAGEGGALPWLTRRGLAFYAACAAAGAALYLTLFAVAGAGGRFAPAFPLYLVLAHAVNAHHYVADAVLWRAPRR